MPGPPPNTPFSLTTSCNLSRAVLETLFYISATSSFRTTKCEVIDALWPPMRCRLRKLHQNHKVLLPTFVSRYQRPKGDPRRRKTSTIPREPATTRTGTFHSGCQSMGSHDACCEDGGYTRRWRWEPLARECLLCLLFGVWRR